MSEIHNGELTQDVILGAVAAWLEQKNDSMMSIEVGFQRDLSRRTINDIIAETKVTLLKPQDFRPMKRGQCTWNDEDQKLIDMIPVKKHIGKEEDDWFEALKDPSGGWKKKSAEMSGGEKNSSRKPSIKATWSDEVVKYKAILWELPSAEYYPVKFVEGTRRALHRRSSSSELGTAQEAPAVREKGEANDRTDQDCRTLPTDLTSSKESLAAEAPTQREKSPPLKEEPKAPSPVKQIVEKKEVASPKEKEEPKVRAKRSTRKRQVNVKRQPDSGELTILCEKNGIVTFSCFTKHRVKKSSKTKKEKS